MRRRAIVGLMAVVSTSALVVGMSVTPGGASVHSAKKPVCAGKTKKQAVKDIKTAYDHFLNGAKYPDAADKEPFIELLSGPNANADLIAQFEASSAANAAAAATTSAKVRAVKCAGKKRADVDFVLLINGEPLEGIAPADASAVLEGKTWKVSAETLCNLQAQGDPSVLDSGPCYEVVSGGA